MTLPTRDHMRRILATAKPYSDNGLFVVLTVPELEEIGLCVADLCELPRQIFATVFGNEVHFYKHGLKSWLGMERAR